MEDTVSVLSWECWLWEEAMDMTDWARLLLTGSAGEKGLSRDTGPPQPTRASGQLAAGNHNGANEEEEGGVVGGKLPASS